MRRISLISPEAIRGIKDKQLICRIGNNDTDRIGLEAIDDKDNHLRGKIAKIEIDDIILQCDFTFTIIFYFTFNLIIILTY